MSLTRRLLALRDGRPWFVTLSVLTVAMLVSWPAVDALLGQVAAIHTSPYGFNDFGAYSRAVDAWLEGNSIYTEQESGGFHGSYLYPPVVLPVFYPFATLDSFSAGAVLFGFFSLFLLWVGIESVVEEFGYRLAVFERVLLFGALFGFHPALWDFKWGQISTLLAALLCFSFYERERGQRGKVGSRYLSGILTTLASVFKLFYATAGAHLLRDRRRFLGAVLTAGVLLAVSTLVFGLSTHQTYLDVLAWGKGWGTEQRPPFMQQTAYYRPLYLIDQVFVLLGFELPDAWAIAATILGVFGVGALSLGARNEPAAARPTFALGVAAVPLLAPRAYTHDLVVMLLPAIILLVTEFDRENGRPWLPVLAVVLLHVHSIGTKLGIYLLGRSEAVFIQPGVYGTFLLVGLAAVRVAAHIPLPPALSR